MTNVLVSATFPSLPYILFVYMQECWQDFLQGGANYMQIDQIF